MIFYQNMNFLILFRGGHSHMTVGVSHTKTSYNHFHLSPEVTDDATVHEVVPP